VTLFGRNLAAVSSVEMTDSGGAVRNAPVLYAAEGQATIVIPADVARGPAVLRVGAMSAPVTIARIAPGIFTRDNSGTGEAAGTADEIEIDGDPYLVLYGTGIRHYTEKHTCTIGGQAVAVVYAGAQGGFPGLDQVNLRLPAGSTGTVTVVLTVDGVAANAVTVTIR